MRSDSPRLSSSPVAVSGVFCQERSGADHRSAEDRRPGQPHQPQTTPGAARQH